MQEAAAKRAQASKPAAGWQVLVQLQPWTACTAAHVADRLQLSVLVATSLLVC